MSVSKGCGLTSAMSSWTTLALSFGSSRDSHSSQLACVSRSLGWPKKSFALRLYSCLSSGISSPAPTTPTAVGVRTQPSEKRCQQAVVVRTEDRAQHALLSYPGRKLLLSTTISLAS